MAKIHGFLKMRFVRLQVTRWHPEPPAKKRAKDEKNTTMTPLNAYSATGNQMYTISIRDYADHQQIRIIS